MRFFHDAPLGANELLEEWLCSLELAAAGITARPRIRILGIEDNVVTLPQDEWSAGRVLAALTPFAMDRLAQSLIVSLASESTIESWRLAPEGVTGLRTAFEKAAAFKAISTVELRDIADAPLLAKRFAWVCLDEPRVLTAEALKLANEIFDVAGVRTVQRVGGASYFGGTA